MHPHSRLLSLALTSLVLGSSLAAAQVPIGTCKQSAAITAVTFSPDGKQILTGSADNSLRLWDANTYKELRQLQGMQARVTAVLYAPDGKSIVAGCQTGMVSAWDTGNFQQRLSMHAGRNSATALALSPDGRNLISGGEDRRMFVRDISNGLFHRVIHGHAGAIHALSFSSDGRHIASAAADKSVRIWDSTNGQEVRKFDTGTESAQSVAYAPDGKQLAAGTKDAVYVWEASTGKQLHKMPGHKGMVNAIAYSKDGKMLATAGDDGDVLVWDATAGRLLRRLGKHGKAVRGVAFSPVGKVLASVGDDNQLYLWDVSPRIFLPAKPVDLTEKDLTGLWETLAGNDFAKAGEAIGTLAACKQSVPFLGERLKKVRPGEDEKAIAQLIVGLDDDAFSVREKATTGLERLGPVAAPHLELALKREMSLEARRRAERILERLKDPQLTPDQYRLQRAVAALELNSSPDARKILEDLAKGAGGAWLALEAQGSLERLKKQ